MARSDLLNTAPSPRGVFHPKKSIALGVFIRDNEKQSVEFEQILDYYVQFDRIH